MLLILESGPVPKESADESRKVLHIVYRRMNNAAPKMNSKSHGLCGTLRCVVALTSGGWRVVALVVRTAWMVGERVETTKFPKHTKGSRWVGEF